ncbi:carbohydrate porin [Archangium minus]|uniref:Carbohydrate porin n=1 Tax=Archangium minus TaxID=83450 RepID=A0ABY9WZ06_9BACT|nr:carbohydrate porin [Archangium violaceum]WNG48373.1 carbohydrate porin [Archangium minus]
MKNKALLAALTATCTAVTAHADPLPIPIIFSGYMRAGTGINVRGGTQVCAGLPGADTKWRLGNECDYVIEPSLNAKLVSSGETAWHVHFMPGIYRAWGGREFQTYSSPGGAAIPDSGTDELVARFGQVYAYGTNIAALGNGKIWVGRRFYNRLQTGINDQFLEINDGDGAGIEDINVVIGKLSVAAMLNPRGSANNNRISVPVRLTGIKDLPSGELAMYVTPSVQLRSDDQVSSNRPAAEANGLAVGVYQTLNGLLLGGNTLLGVKMDWNGPTRNSRVVLQQSAFVAGTSIEGIAEYRINKAAGNAGNKWFGIGVRSDTHIAGPFRVLAEAGHDVVKPDNGGHTRNMTKLTLATAVSAGDQASSRPTFRLFVTHAIWDEAARQSFDPTSRLRQVFGDQKAGTSVGLQAEAWW